ncbi:MAG: ATP-binding protein [Candidatus Omnitrophica bacterium]|nr:ATP-binding protein [Candidatus Omnitrophota bacterium]
MKTYIRQRFFRLLWNRLHGLPRLLQVVVGPRQVGKTTLAKQILDRWKGPKLYETADQPTPPTVLWIQKQWDDARRLVSMGKQEVLLILDEVPKIPRWSEVVKKLADEDADRDIKLRVVLLGSSALLMQRGLSESLAGRFELHRHPHWSFRECEECFGLSADEYLYFGGYPGALALRKDEDRWKSFVRDSLIETVLSKDVLLVSPVSKPALLRQAFGLAIAYPAEIVSYQKMLGTLQDAGNTTTIASYLRLLSNAFLICPLERFSGSRVKQRGSTPKILVLDNALVTAMLETNFKATRKDTALWGRLTENAVGAQLYWHVQDTGGNLFYWRDRQDEVDFVFTRGRQIVAVEVKSGRSDSFHGLSAFGRRYPVAKRMIVTSAKEFLSRESSETLAEYMDYQVALNRFRDKKDVITTGKKLRKHLG